MTADSLKAWRERMKFRRYQVADMFGIGRNTYAKYEAGMMPVPKWWVMPAKRSPTACRR